VILLVLFSSRRKEHLLILQLRRTSTIPLLILPKAGEIGLRLFEEKRTKVRKQGMA